MFNRIFNYGKVAAVWSFLVCGYGPAAAQPLPLNLPSPAVARQASSLNTPRVQALRGKIARGKIFAAYRELCGIYEANGFFADSAVLHREQASLYRAHGLEDAAIIEEMRATEIENTLQLYTDTKVSREEVDSLYTAAALEPVLGCYSGAYIDQDETMGDSFIADGQSHHDPDQFKALTGRAPSNLFIYWKYGRPFPSDWVRRLKRRNCIPNIAWEPDDLDEVQEDAYLKRFAADLAAAKWPVFIRFASEMNGFWTPYHRDPDLYREKFRLVYKALHARTDEVALIWCVGNPPLTNIDRYYPGDDACDWVGVNFYSVPWHENNPQRPAFSENPLALLEPIYQRYARRKPIAICEYAASHSAALDHKQILEFAKEKLSLVYGALPLLYPRVKLIDWFSANTMLHPQPGKTLNDYLLAEDPTVRQAWTQENSVPWYLAAPQAAEDELPPLARILGTVPVQSGATIRVWAKCHSAVSRCWLELDGKLVAGQRKTGAWQYILPELRSGSHVLRAMMYDDQGRFMAQRWAKFQVSPTQ